jgi:hypothetical protein
MSHQISPQHPAVVLRSHYVLVRALLATATIAVLGLTAAVVILATTDTGGTSTSSVAPVGAPAPAAPGVRYDGGPEEGTSATSMTPVRAPAPAAPGVRYDGGPEEGTSAIQPSSAGSPTGIRYDGGPEEGTSGFGH